MDDHPELTVIRCRYQRQFGGPQYDHFIKLDGQWHSIGCREDPLEQTWEDVTDGYEAVEIVTPGG
jgi:hypothetical protein